jgi:hypothetical protein
MFSGSSVWSYQRVIKLDQRRNDIVHNGAEPAVSAAELNQMLVAVLDLLEWLETT